MTPIWKDWAVWGMEGLKSPVNTLAAFGLALSGAFGLVGRMTAQPNLQAAAWGIGGCGLVMACALLT